MERYFELVPDEGFDFILGENDGYKIFKIFRDHVGEDLRALWSEYRVEVVSKNRGKKLKRGDFLIGLWGSALVFRESVQKTMGKVLEREGEVLGFSSQDGEPLYLLNAPICDCLLAVGNEPLTGTAGEFPEHLHRWCSFDNTKSKGRHIFMVPQLIPRTFVSEKIVNMVATLKLTGARFNSITRRVD